MALRERGFTAQVFGDRLHVWVAGDRAEAPAEFTRATAAFIGDAEVRPITPSLEDVYIARLNEQHRDAAGGAAGEERVAQ